MVLQRCLQGFNTGYLKAVWPDLLGALLRSGRPRTDLKNEHQKNGRTAFRYPVIRCQSEDAVTTPIRKWTESEPPLYGLYVVCVVCLCCCRVSIRCSWGSYTVFIRFSKNLRRGYHTDSKGNPLHKVCTRFVWCCYKALWGFYKVVMGFLFGFDTVVIELKTRLPHRFERKPSS